MSSLVKNVAWAVAASFLVALGGTGIVVLGIATAPWGAPVVLVLLWLYWRFLGGGWVRPAAALRAAHLRARLVPRRVAIVSFVAGVLGLVALAGLWIACVELFGGGGNPTMATDAASSPLLVAGYVIASLIVSTTEEAAFRGYALVRLERVLPGIAAVMTSSLLFALWHAPTQGFIVWKIAFFLLVGILFGTIAHLTRSTLPALPVHFVGDVAFFTIVWPSDALRNGVDAGLPFAVAQAVLAGTLAVLALVYLSRIVGPRSSRISAAAWTGAEPATRPG